MPLPEAEEVEVVNPAGRALMVLPEIRVDVFARKLRRHVASHLNGVSGVARDCGLVFSITNPHVVPDLATVEWTVRNEGQESALIGDLGHRWSGARTKEQHQRFSSTCQSPRKLSLKSAMPFF